MHYHNIILGQTNCRWYLSSNGNKATLSAFVCNYITSSSLPRIIEEQTIILAGGFEDAEETKTILKEGMESLEGYP